MSDRQGTSGPQFRADRPVEHMAVRTTIVGGRPPGAGQGLGPIPRGVEVLVKKASVDPSFRDILLERRAEAAREIGLELDPAEVMMLRAVPAAQLQAIIAKAVVPQAHRRAFLGRAAAAMLAALGFGLEGCDRGGEPGTKGIRPDRPDKFTTKGVEPSRPKPKEEPPKKESKDSEEEGPGEDGPEAKVSEGEKPKAEVSKPSKPATPGPPEEQAKEPGATGNTLRSPEETKTGPTGKNPLRPERPPVSRGIRPDPVPMSLGIRPDRPPKRENQ